MGCVAMSVAQAEETYLCLLKKVSLEEAGMIAGKSGFLDLNHS